MKVKQNTGKHISKTKADYLNEEMRPDKQEIIQHMLTHARNRKWDTFRRPSRHNDSLHMIQLVIMKQKSANKL